MPCSHASRRLFRGQIRQRLICQGRQGAVEQADVDLAALRHKSGALGDLFITLVEQELPGSGLALASPRNAAERGSQVSLLHPEGYPIMQALIARGVIGDFRAPDLLRFGFTPLYNRFTDAWDAAVTLAEVLHSRAWDREEYGRRRTVT